MVLPPFHLDTEKPAGFVVNGTLTAVAINAALTWDILS